MEGGNNGLFGHEVSLQETGEAIWPGGGKARKRLDFADLRADLRIGGKLQPSGILAAGASCHQTTGNRDIASR